MKMNSIISSTTAKSGVGSTTGKSGVGHPADDKIQNVKSVDEGPADGGWGWIVVTASFISHMIVDGCGYSYGILFIELLDVFGDSRGKTAFVGSLFVSVPAILGPIASAATNRFGFRATTMVGGLVTCVGCFLSAFVDSVDQLYFTYGIICGVGISPVYVNSVVVMSFYFEKKRAFATGIAMAGSGIGTFVFAPMIEALIKVYGWRGTFIILSGFLLNIVVCGAVFRPLPVRKQRQTQTEISNNTEPKKSTSLPDLESESNKKLCQRNKIGLNQDKVCLENVPEDLPENKRIFPSKSSADVNVSQVAVSGGRAISKISETKSAKNDCNKEDSCTERTGDNSGVNNEANRTDVTRVCHSIRNKHNQILSSSSEEIINEAKTVEFHSTSCPEIFTRPTVGNESESKSNFYTVRSHHANQLETSKSRCAQVFLDWFDFSVFKSSVFNLFCLHTVLLFVSYDTPYVYAPVRARSHGVSEDGSSFIVALAGLFSTVGQVSMGYAGDHPFINALVFYNAMTMIAGIVTLVTPTFNTFIPLAVLSSAYGFFISTNFALTTKILVELLGVQRLTDAYGVVSLAQGASSLLGPPLSGWISDACDSYEVAFYVAGTIICLSGVLLFAAPLAAKCDRHSSNKLKACQSIYSEEATNV